MFNQERKNYIRAQREMATYKKNEFQSKKIEGARKETNMKMDMERNNIHGYELEAQQLEMMEAELLKKLQET